MVLLAGVLGRHHVDYAGGQLLGTVMRHVLPPLAVVLCPRRVVEPAGPAPLVALAGLALLLPPARLPARAPAVPMPPIAPPADEEDLAASGPVADDEAERFHGSGRDRQELDGDHSACDERLVGPGSGRTT
jgi:hypothetical protein